MKTVNFSNYVKFAKDGDYIPALKEALKHVTDNTILKFEKGRYLFKVTNADTALQDFPYHNYGNMPCAFHFKNLKNITLDGGGSEFVFGGRILPFIFDHCENVTFRNLSEDFDRPWYTEGKVVRSTKKYVDIVIDKEKFPVRFENGQLHFISEYYDYDDKNIFCIEFSPETGSLAYGHNYFFLTREEHPEYNFYMRHLNKVEQIAEDTFRMYIEGGEPPYVGSIICIQHCDRGSTGVSLNTCKNVVVEDFNLYHCAGMGISLNSCTDTLIQRVTVLPAPGSGRIMSIMADGIHCINAMGKMEVFDCLFESMNDDAGNFHGFYPIVKEVIDKRTLKCIAYHNCRTGVESGDEIRFINKSIMKPCGKCIIIDKAEYPEDRGTLILKFKEDLPGYVREGLAIENRTKVPSLLHIKNVHTGKNRPRGFLISVPCKTIIEDCEFYNSDCALDFTGDANYWFESGPVEDVTIKNNIFRDCGHASFCGAITFRPSIPKGDYRFHSGVKIHDNVFESFNPLMAEFRNVKDVEFYDNKYIKKTDVYKPIKRPAIICENSDFKRLEY